jgi:hypothetical protein
MSGRLTAAVTVLAVAAAGAAVLLLALPGASNTSSPVGVGASAGPPDAPVRGCRQRADGRILRPRRESDTIIGPVAFLGAGETYRHFASRPDSELEPYPGVVGPAMKVLALVRAGRSATLVVPRRQRRWRKLVYGQWQHRRGEYAITLRPGACPGGQTRGPRGDRGSGRAGASPRSAQSGGVWGMKWCPHCHGYRSSLKESAGRLPRVPLLPEGVGGAPLLGSHRGSPSPVDMSLPRLGVHSRGIHGRST